jgi:CBS domain-containing protein
MSLVKDLLRRKGAFVAAVSPLTWVVDAAREMSQRKIGSLVVLDRGRIVGVLTERDLLTRVVAERRDPDATSVAEVMTRDVVVCRPESTLDDCKSIVSSCRLRHLPVVDANGNVVGMVTSGDILHRELDDQAQAIETLQAYIYGASAVTGINSRGSN